MSKKKEFQNIINFSNLNPDVNNNNEDSVHVVDALRVARPIIRSIPINSIIPSTVQVRRVFTEIEELSVSIKDQGLLQEIAVKRTTEDMYELVWGERRWRACKLLGWTSIPARIFTIDVDSNILGIIENIQRENLLPEEEAIGIWDMMKNKHYSQSALAAILGKSQGHISKCGRIADFVNSDGVWKVLDELRQTRDIGFELLYTAASRASIEEGIALLKAIDLTATVKSVRRVTPSKVKSSPDVVLLKFLKNIRTSKPIPKLQINDIKDHNALEFEVITTVKWLEHTLNELKEMQGMFTTHSQEPRP